MTDNGFQFTEEMFDKGLPPLLVLISLSGLSDQLEGLTDVEPELTDAFAAWEPEIRDRAVADLRERVQHVRTILDGLDAALAEVTS